MKFYFLIIAIFVFFLNSCSDEHKLKSQNFESGFNKFLSRVELPEKLDFCGENLPLSDPEIRERAERELLLLLQQPGQIILYFKRAGRYFPMYEKILRENGLPDDIKYLSVAESALYMSRSSVGAVGLWQFMPETGKKMGLIVNDFVDERRHPEKSTMAAAKFLKSGYNTHKSWILTAAGYNMGHTGVAQSIDYQNVDDYFGLYLNEETSRFVFRIAIIKEVMKNPERYGFDLKEIEVYQPDKFTLVKVDTEISDLSAWARANGTTYKQVKLLNPWILKRNLPKPKKGEYYEIALPKN